MLATLKMKGIVSALVLYDQRFLVLRVLQGIGIRTIQSRVIIKTIQVKLSVLAYHLLILNGIT